MVQTFANLNTLILTEMPKRKIQDRQQLLPDDLYSIRMIKDINAEPMLILAQNCSTLTY